MKNIITGTSLTSVFIFYAMLDFFGFMLKHFHGFTPEQMVSYLNTVAVIMAFRLLIPHYMEKKRSQMYIKQLSDDELKSMLEIIKKHDKNDKE